MRLRVARHTSDIEKTAAFYTDILGFTILGSFTNHDGYDGIFIGKPALDWHLEFTVSANKPDHHYDEDDLLVFYSTSEEFETIQDRLFRNDIRVIDPKNPYWKKNGKMFRDPDGYRIVITSMTSL